MAKPKLSTVFDGEGFWDEVDQYRQRHELCWKDIAYLSNIDPYQLGNAWRAKKGTIYILAAISGSLDISIDKFVKIRLI